MTGSLQVKNGKYYIVLNRYENGKRKPKWIPTGLAEKGNKRRAEQMLRAAIAEEEQQRPGAKNSDMLFAEYILHWLSLSAQRVDEITIQGYTILTKRHILPYFEKNGVKLGEVNRQMLQEFLDEKGRSGRLDGKGGLSPKSIRELKNILNQTLNEALRDELIPSNPCALLRLPPRTHAKANFYTAEQLNALLAAVKEDPLYPLIRTAIVFGLRRSELLGLKWDCIDFENDILTVKHTVVKVSKTVEKDKTKNKSSYRSFPIPPDMRVLFAALQNRQRENSRLFGRSYIKTDYVFCWDDGRPFSPDYVSHRFKDLLEKHGLPHIRFHELRHSCASLLINNGFSLKDVQEWMGHSDISTTADIYGHLETQRKLTMADRVSGCINQ